MILLLKLGTEARDTNKALQNITFSTDALLCPTMGMKSLQALNKLQHKALKLILGTNTIFNQLAAGILCGLPPMLIQTDVISINSGLNSPCVATPCIRDTKIANCQRYAPTEIWWIGFTELQEQLELTPSQHVSRTLTNDKKTSS